MARTALVLSGGGMFGAYQAGAWRVLADMFEPDLVIGASIGALNGWAIAGGCAPDRLIEMWLGLDTLSGHRFRVPRQPAGGFLDSRPVNTLIQQIHSRYRPKVAYGLVLTETFRLKARLFQGADLTWRHLAASAAVPAFFDQQRIDGCLYSDGGLLSSLPLWAAAEMGAERIVAVNPLAHVPSAILRGFTKAVRAIARFHPVIPASLEIVHIAPGGVLGSAKDTLYWKRGNVERWIAQGSADALEACRQITWQGALV